MMKRISILLIALVLMSIPISTNAQTTGLQVQLIGLDVTNDEFVTIAVEVSGAYSVCVDVFRDDDFALYTETGFPTNDTNVWGFDIPTGGAGYHNVRILFYGFNYYSGLVEEDEVSFGYTTPDPIHQVYEPPPFEQIPPEADYEPWPEVVYDSVFSSPWFLLLIGFAIFLGFAGFILPQRLILPQPEETKQKKCVLKWADDSALGVGKEYSGTYYAMKMSKIDMPNVYPYPEELKNPDLTTHWRKPYSNPHLPEEDVIELPDLSSPDDDVDWRICPWCGTWTHGEKTRCIYCDGRLGRPLGRNDK